MLLVNTAVYGISCIFLICVWFISCGDQLFALLPTCARCANKFIRLKWFHDARWVITLKLIFCCFSISGYWFVSRSFFSILLTFYSCVLPPLVFLYGVCLCFGLSILFPQVGFVHSLLFYPIELFSIFRIDCLINGWAFTLPCWSSFVQELTSHVALAIQTKRLGFKILLNFENQQGLVLVIHFNYQFLISSTWETHRSILSDGFSRYSFGYIRSEECT